MNANETLRKIAMLAVDAVEEGSKYGPKVMADALVKVNIQFAINLTLLARQVRDAMKEKDSDEWVIQLLFMTSSVVGSWMGLTKEDKDTLRAAIPKVVEPIEAMAKMYEELAAERKKDTPAVVPGPVGPVNMN